MIRSDINIRELKTNIQKINCQIEKMHKAKTEFDISFGEAEVMRSTFANELLAFNKESERK